MGSPVLIVDGAGEKKDGNFVEQLNNVDQHQGGRECEIYEENSTKQSCQSHNMEILWKFKNSGDQHQGEGESLSANQVVL